MNCDVIRDLLPLYADGLTSEVTGRMIEEHLQSCEECRSFYQQMCKPPQPEFPKPVPDYREALKKQKQKNRRKVLWFSLCAALTVFLLWWAYMEIHFGGDSVEIISQNTQHILKEVPELALTQKEKDLAGELFGFPAVQERIRFAGMDLVIVEPEDYRLIPAEEAEKMLKEYLPVGAELAEMGVLYSSVTIDYTCDGTRVLLEYADGDGSGYPDVIRKTLARPNRKGEVCTVCTLTHYVGTDWTECEKTGLKHSWIGFLKD